MRETWHLWVINQYLGTCEATLEELLAQVEGYRYDLYEDDRCIIVHGPVGETVTYLVTSN
jgi:hypothetical protein